MTLLVDTLTTYATNQINPKARRHGRRWCHLVSDSSLEELHEFAERLGLKRAWFQRDHYDLTPRMREKALRLGAEEVSMGELAERWGQTVRCKRCGDVSFRNRLTSPCPGCGRILLEGLGKEDLDPPDV